MPASRTDSVAGFVQRPSVIKDAVSGAVIATVSDIDGTLVLDKKDLQGADLRHLDLSGMDLSGVDFSGAIISYADFSHCNLNGVWFNAGRGHDSFDHVNLTGANLESSRFVRRHINSCSFQGCNLLAGSFTGCQIQTTDFTGANFGSGTMHVDLGGNVRDCDFRGADLTNVILESGATFFGCTIDHATRLPHLEPPPVDGRHFVMK